MKGGADRSRSRRAFRLVLLATLAWLLSFAAHAAAQVQEKRCDLALASTPGGNAACLDLLALAQGGGGIETAGNATRIDRQGLVLCKSAFRAVTPAEADIVFIYDNSGSMLPAYAHVDAARRDTSFFFAVSEPNSGCRSTATSGHLTYATQAGPRTVPLLLDATGCVQHSGDPYLARGAVIRAAIDYMAAASPGSSAGAVAFTTRTAHVQAPVRLGSAAVAAQVKASIVLDTSGGTHYGPPLALAKSWLRNPAYARAPRQAIVFLSDGAPSDTLGSGNYLAAVDSAMPPIFSIWLGRRATSDTARLQQLSARTGGTFHRVDAGRPDQVHAVMQGIVKSLLVTTMPRSIRIENRSLAQASVSTALHRGADSSVAVTLDSILALREGDNELRIRLVLDDTTVREHVVRVRADGPDAAVSAGPLACFDQPSLVLLDSAGYEDSGYAVGRYDYRAKLTRYSSDLSRVSVTARSDSGGGIPTPPSDSEALTLSLEAGGRTSWFYRGPAAVQGDVARPLPGNGLLEAARGAVLRLSWAHPRDPRERAEYRLPENGVLDVLPFVHMVRVRDVAGGVGVAGAVPDPVVIRGGAELRKGGSQGASVAWKGCLYNCTGVAATADPAHVPSFIVKTQAPFSFTVHVFDTQGRFVNSSRGAVKAADWAAQPWVGDSVAVVMSILPLSRKGNPWATGAYIVKAIIHTAAAEVTDGKGGRLRVAAGSFTMLNRFGYAR